MARDTKRDMVISAVKLLQERGADGVTLDAVLTRSDAPRGSIYHHFPGGRAQILDEALQLAGDSMSSLIDRFADEGATATLQRFTGFWKKLLTDSGFSAGCPVASAAVTATGDDADLAAQAGTIFERWCDALRDAFIRDGLDRAAAARLAHMSVAAIEGAVVLCRAQRSMKPLDDVAIELALLIDSQKLFARNTRRRSR